MASRAYRGVESNGDSVSDGEDRRRTAARIATGDKNRSIDRWLRVKRSYDPYRFGRGWCCGCWGLALGTLKNVTSWKFTAVGLKTFALRMPSRLEFARHKDSGPVLFQSILPSHFDVTAMQITLAVFHPHQHSNLPSKCPTRYCLSRSHRSCIRGSRIPDCHL